MKRSLLLLLSLVISFVSVFAQDVPDKTNDAWYNCTYEYRYSIVPGDKREYIESREHRAVILINAVKLEMYFSYSANSRGVAVSLLRDDENEGYVSPDRSISLSSDFTYLTLLEGDETNVMRLTDCYRDYSFEEEEEGGSIDSEEDPADAGKEWPSWITYSLFILLALFPAVILFVFIMWRDRLRPEPAKELILACAMGLLSVPIAVFFSDLNKGLGLFSGFADSTWLHYLKVSFWGAAIPEEFGKIVILWLFFKWRCHQDEFMDGIVYAVCIGLAFATVENMRYVLNSLSYSSPIALSTAITRALMPVPGHFGFAVLMGFFFSFYLFGKKNRSLYLLLAYAVPVLFHWLYDAFAFMESLPSIWKDVMSFGFFLVFFAMSNLGIKVIRTALMLDEDTYSERKKISSSRTVTD